MGVRTEHTTRLLDEIATLRTARHVLLAEIRHTTDLRRAGVSAMLTGFSKARAEAGRRMKADLTSSVDRLRGDVGRLRKEVSADIDEARQAWLGTVSRRSRAIPTQTPPPSITAGEGIEGVEGQPQAAAEPEPEEDGTEEVPEAPREISEIGMKERGAGTAVKTELRARKKKRRH